MKRIYYILIVHAVLLILTSTNFSIISFASPNKSLSWNYATYSYKNGFGYEYASAYSLPQTLTYLAAYALGLILFLQVYRKLCPILATVGILLCVLGLVSFLIEASHWIFEHNLSWIASFPIALALLWIILAAKLATARMAKSKYTSESQA